MSESLKLLLISDIHCVGANPLAISRLVGEAKSTEEIQQDFSALLSEFHGVADYVLIAGDFTDNGRSDQYTPLLEVMQEYDPKWFCIIPGNHDTANFVTLESWNARMRRFKKFMHTYLPEEHTNTGDKKYFPYVRKLNDDFALIGLDSTMPRTAVGRLGQRQMRALERFLSDPELGDAHRIILLHHDTTGDTKLFTGFEIHYGNVMKDADEFHSLVKAYAEDGPGSGITIVNGHTHLRHVEGEFAPGVNVFTVPSFGSKFEDDFIAIDLSKNGEYQEIPADLSKGRQRKFRKIGKSFFPKIHT